LADTFDQEILSKINFYRDRVDLLTSFGDMEIGSDEFTIAADLFTNDMVGMMILFDGFDETVIGHVGGDVQGDFFRATFGNHRLGFRSQGDDRRLVRFVPRGRIARRFAVHVYRDDNRMGITVENQIGRIIAEYIAGFDATLDFEIDFRELRSIGCGM